jgi:hypothetical protein
MKKALRIIAISVGIVLVVYLVLCFMGPAEFKVTRAISIQQSPDQVKSLVTDFSQWRQWSAWSMRDTNMTGVFTGTPHQIGHHWEWKSESEGDGSQEIVGMTDDSVRMELKFAGFDKPNYGIWKFAAEGEGTKASWTMDGGAIAFPFRGMVYLFIGNLEEDFEQGLSNLKSYAEKNSTEIRP